MYKLLDNKIVYMLSDKVKGEACFDLLGICFVKGKSLQEIIYKNICMCYSGYIKK